MRATHIAIIALASLAPGASAAAQTGEALIQKVGAVTPIANLSYPAQKNLVYKVAWDVTAGPSKPEEATEGYAAPASFLVMADQEGIDRKKVHLAIIVHGAATQTLLNNAAYKAATGKDNASVPILEALSAAGVQVIVCGQALIRRKVPRDQLLPFVKVTTSATMARATLAMQGYATFTP
jgi:intracellular sulfur oxidation DsrE/DsrF family protein